MANRVRKNELKVYLSDEEQEIINKKIEEAGIKNKSAYVRKMLCDGLIINVDLSIIKDNNSQINKIGNNLNQITKQLNGLNYISPEDVKRIEEMSKEIKKMQREILLNFQEII